MASVCPVLGGDVADTCSFTSIIMLLVSMMTHDDKSSFLTAEDFPPDISASLTDGAIVDFIVVGGGSAGAVVAARLAEAHPTWSVLLLEAGSLPDWSNEVPALFFSIQGGPMDWAYTTQKDANASRGFKGQVSRWPRGKVLGGTSQLNAMLYVRGHPSDYDEWSAMGNKGWSHDELLPYFVRAEKFLGEDDGHDGQMHGRAGPLLVTRYVPHSELLPVMRGVYAEMEQKTYGLDQDGYGMYLCPTTISGGRRASTARCYLTRDRVKTRLQMALGAEVKRININDGRARGVEVRMSDGRVLNVAARREVIVSGGAINSPQLLLASDVRLPGIGRNLQDHLTTFLLMVEFDQAAPDSSTPTIEHLIGEYQRTFDGPLSDVGVTNLLWFTHSDPNVRRNAQFRRHRKPDVQIHLLEFQRGQMDALHTVAQAIGLNDHAERSLRELLTRKRLLSVAVTLLHPTSIGNVTVSDQGRIHINANYLSDKDNQDMKVLLDGIEFVEEILHTKAMQRVNATWARFDDGGYCQQMAFATREYFECHLRHFAATIYHPVGTCKMGQDPSETGGGAAVVDEKLKVWGVRGLRVIDASIMPKIIGGNTNVPTIMIGEKGADMIIKEHLGNNGP